MLTCVAKAAPVRLVAVTEGTGTREGAIGCNARQSRSKSAASAFARFEVEIHEESRFFGAYFGVLLCSLPFYLLEAIACGKLCFDFPLLTADSSILLLCTSNMAILMSSLAELKSRGFARLRPILPLRSLPSAERRDPHIAAASLRTKASQHVVAAGSRLWRALPAVLIGILLNTLDAVSTGLLVFPTGAPFSSLQVQAMSLYLMSTITSQLTMTLGGSRFPGALGSMLIEILPFLRDIASAIQGTLGNDSPSLLPTVFAAYAMTSLLIGVVFFVLGALKCGRLVEYFPKTVLTGAIGMVQFTTPRVAANDCD